MWPLGIILLPPCFDLAPCISQSGEPVEVQALIPELSLEAFDKGILHGFPRIDVDNTDLALFRPREEGVCRKLRTIVGNNILRFSPCLYEPVEHPGNDLCGDRGVHMDDRALPCSNVKDREAPECPSPRGSVMNKIKGPLVIDALRNRQGDPKGKGELLSRFCPDRKGFLSVQTFCSFVVDNKTLFLEKKMEPPYPVSRFFSRQDPHALQKGCIVMPLRNIPAD